MKQSLTERGYFTTGTQLGLYKIMEFTINPFYDDLKKKKKVRELFRKDDRYKDNFRNGFFSITGREPNGDSTYEIGLLLGLLQDFDGDVGMYDDDDAKTLEELGAKIGISSHTQFLLENADSEVHYQVEKVVQENFFGKSRYPFHMFSSPTIKPQYKKVNHVAFVVSRMLNDKGNRSFVFEKTPEDMKRNVSPASSGVETLCVEGIGNISTMIEERMQKDLEEKDKVINEKDKVINEKNKEIERLREELRKRKREEEEDEDGEIIPSIHEPPMKKIKLDNKFQIPVPVPKKTENNPNTNKHGENLFFF